MIKDKPYRYVACDPDVKNAAYAVVDEKGDYVDSWVIKAKSIEDTARVHATEPPPMFLGNEDPKDYNYILVVESQQFYKGDDARLVKSLLQLARACGISMNYLSRIFPSFESIELILPRTWTKGRPKHVNQFWAIKNQGWTPVKSKSAKSYTYAKELVNRHAKTEQKHIMDAIAIAMYAAETHRKQLKLQQFKAEKGSFKL